MPVHKLLQIALCDPVGIRLPGDVLAEGEVDGGHDLSQIGDGLTRAYQGTGPIIAKSEEKVNRRREKMCLRILGGRCLNQDFQD